MKRNIVRNILAALIFLIGLGVLFYPVGSDLWNQYRQNQLAEDYEQTVRQLTPEDYSKWRNAAKKYNKQLQWQAYDAFSGTDLDKDDPYWSLLNVNNDGVMGYLEIPKISVRLAIYHGTSEKVLEQGVGHLVGTSLPVGGKGTHSVLSAHCGLPTALLFTNLDQMQKGDLFYLHVLGDTLAYEVDQILVVEPDDISALEPVAGKDYVTLLTCTPYGVNTHRLLVRGHRTTVPDNKQDVTPLDQILASLGWKAKLLIALAAIALLAIVIALVKKRRKKREN